MRAMICSWALVAAAAICGVAQGVEIPLVVEEPADVARTGEVVSGGIPLPEGKYKDPMGFALREGGREVPVQVSPMVRYPDGSLHWALVSFPVSLDAGASKTFVLEDTPGKAAPDNAVTVTEDGSTVEIANGIVSLRIDREKFNGFESVGYKGTQVFRTAKAALTADGKGGPGKLTHFEYRYRGPVRVSLYMKGTYGDAEAPTWSMTVTLKAGEPAVHVIHNLRNGGRNAKKTMTVSDPVMSLGCAGEMKTGDGGTSGGKVDAYAWKAFGGAADALVFMRHGGRRMKSGFAIGIEGGELVMHLGGAGGAVDLEWGEHTSSEIDIVFGEAAGAAALASPLHARAPCAWYAEHDSMGVGRRFGSLADETATYEAQDWANAGDPEKMPTCRSDPAFYTSSMKDVHFDSECDHLQGLVFGYIRTGQRGFLDRAHGWADYWRTYFLYRSDEWVYGKEGSYKSPKWGSSSHSRGCTEGCHYYASGLFNYALLTGDIDALEAAFDGAEFANMSWTGQYNTRNVKPGTSFSKFGTRGFCRNFVVIARAYDVARTPEWKDALMHHVRMALLTPERDQRGFTTGGQKRAKDALGKAKKYGPGAMALLEKGETQVVDDETLRHPAYGDWRPCGVMSWAETIENRALMMTYEALIDSPDPVDHVAAEDLMDHAIAQAYFGAKYMFHPVQKAIRYKLTLDFPVPDYIAVWYGGEWETYKPKGMNSSYTKWWPNVFAVAYRLTGEKVFRDTCMEVVWWGLNRTYTNAPHYPEGEAPKYSRIIHNTKGDWMTPTCLAFGLVAFPRKEESPPAAVADLAATARGDGTVELTWTAPGDEGGGAPMRYQVKWAEKPLVNYIQSGDEYRAHFKNGALDVTYWTFAANVAGEPAPRKKGAKETMTLSAPAGKTIHVGVRTFDDSHNRSALSNIARVEVK